MVSTVPVKQKKTHVHPEERHVVLASGLDRLHILHGDLQKAEVVRVLQTEQKHDVTTVSFRRIYMQWSTEFSVLTFC